MDEQYFQDLFNWISSKDPSYPNEFTYDQFKQKMQSPEYAQKMDSWVGSVDPNYLSQLKKKGQKSSLIPQVQPQAAQPTQVPYQTPEQQESATMASQLAATSSASQPQARPAQKPSASQFFDVGPMVGQQQQPVSESTAMPEYGAEMKMKAEETQQKIKTKFPEYLKPVLESITPELMSYSEEYVVPELKYQLEPMGFKFDEAIAGFNAVKITAPNGQSIKVPVSAADKYSASQAALKIQEFVQKNTANIEPEVLKGLEKEYTAEKTKFKSEEDMKKTISDFTKKAESFNEQKKRFLSQKTDLDRQEKFLQEATPEERNTPEYKDRLNNVMKMRAELMSFGQELDASGQKMAGQSQELEARVGSYVTKSQGQGTATGALGSWFLEGLGDIFAFGFNKAVDLLYTQPESNVLNKQGKRRFVEIVKSRGVQVPIFKSDEEFDAWSKSLALGEGTREEIINQIRDERVKNIKYGADEGEMSLMEMARKGNRAIYGDKNTTVSYTDLAQEGFWGGAIAGLTKSLPAMLMPGGWVARTTAFYGQAEASLMDEMSKDPDFKDVTEADKMLITLPIGIANAVLEEFGFRNMINSKGLLNNLVLKGLKKSTTTTTAASFKEFVREEVDNMITRGLLTVTAAGLAEAETGAFQQAGEFAIKDIYNAVEGKDMFNTPDKFSDWMKEVAVAGAQEAVGGFILGMPSAVGAAYSKKGFLNMDDDTFTVFEKAANNQVIEKAFVASLKSKLNEGTITMNQAKETLNNYRKSISLFNALPEGLTIEGKKEAMNLLKERADLEDQIQNKDEALVKPQKDRINAINESLTKISENAIQEQSAAEGLLRTEQPEVGLPQMGQGSEIITDEKEGVEAETEKIAPPAQQGLNVENDGLSGISSFETSMGSVYTVTPEGKTQRFKTATGEQNDPQDLTVFANLDGQKEQDFLEAIQRSKESKRKVYVADENGNIIRNNEDARNKKLFLVITNEEGTKVLDFVEASTTPKEGLSVYDQRSFSENGNTMTERHLGNKVTKITQVATQATTETQAATATQEAPKVEEKTPLQKATEERRKAKALLNSLRSGMGITPSAKMTALAKYHRALVNEAIQYIKEGGKTAKAFAKKIGTKYSIAIEKAWNEATGKITPIQDPEDLGYTYEDIYDDDMSAVEGYEEMMDEVEFKANEATKGKKYVQRDLKRARKTKKNLEKAKAQEEQYKADFERLLKEAKDLVSNSAIYQEADDIQKDKLIRDVEIAFGISQKRGPSPAELFGDVTSVNKLMEVIDFLFEDANKSKNYLAEVYKKAKDRYTKYKNSEEYKRGSEKDVRLKNKVVKAKQEMDEYANKNTQEAINELKNSQIYKKASPEEQKRMLEYLKDKFSKSQKTRILPTQLFRDIVDVKMITMKEMDLIQERIKAFSKGAKAWIAAQKSLVKQLGDLVTKGSITNAQMESVLKKFSAVDMANESSIENFVEYMTKIFKDAEYANKIDKLAAKRTAAKKNILTKLGVATDLIESASRMLAVNPYLIPDSVLDDYIYLLDMLGDRSAVLNLADKSFVQNKVNDVMNEVNNDIALADNLKLVFDNYADKVIVDGKVSYSKTIAKMLKENKISDAAAEFMTKYKSRIMPAEPKGLTAKGAYAKVRGFIKSGDSLAKAIKRVAQNEGVTEQEVKDMLDELGREKTALVKQLRSAPINGGQLAMRDERALAAKLQELIKTDGINGLEMSELEILAKVIGNINSGFISNSAQQIAEKIESVNDGKVMFDSVMRAKLPSISKAYAKLKKLIFGTTEAQIMIERNPLFYVDQVIGDMKSKDVFNALFKKVTQAHSSYSAEINKINDIIKKEMERVAESYKMDPKKTKKSSYKMMAYMIEREFQSNPDLKSVHSAVDFLERTIKEIDKLGSFYNENDKEMLEEVLNEINALKDANGVVDLNNFLSEFNKQEKDAINALTGINKSMGDKALFTSSVIRGSNINLIDNYVHRDVIYSALPGPGEIRPSTISAAQNAMMPSTAAGTLEERTEAVSPINFNVFNSVMKGARNTLLDYHMTAPVRTARMALNNTEQRLDELTSVPKENRQIFNALKTSFEDTLDDVLVKDFVESTSIDEFIKYITKTGYRAVLAGAPRFLGELSSNFVFAMTVDPKAFTKGISYKPIMMSPDAVLILDNVKSTVTQRVIPSESLSGSFIDTGILNKSVGIKNDKTRGDVVNKMQKIHNYGVRGISTKKFVNSIELLNDFLISTPDKLIVRPLWFGSFANEFKEIAGVDVDLNKIAKKDEAYMNQYKNEIARATEAADNTVVRAAAGNNPFMGVIKNRVKQSKGAAGAFRNLFIIFNSYMTNFLTYEYITARTGIYAAMGNGMVSRQKGIQMLAGVTARMMVYSALTKMIGNALTSLLSGVDDDEEDQEESFWQNFGQLFASSASALMFGRDFGNATKTVVNYGIEGFNEKYLDFLREGEYNKFDDAIAYSILTPKEDQRGTDFSEIAINASGPFRPMMQTTKLIVKNWNAEEKTEPGARQRQIYEQNIRIPLEIAGNAGLVPFYKDIRNAALKSIYASIKEEKKAEEAKSRLLDKEWSQKKKREIEALEKMLETETDLNKINIIQEKIYEARMDRKKHKAMLEIQKGERQYKRQLKESLLGGYEDMYELKRYDPDLYEQNFGENSDYYRNNKDEMEVDKEVNQTRKSIRDTEENYSEPSKSGFGSRKFGTRDSKKSGFGSRKFGERGN